MKLRGKILTLLIPISIIPLLLVGGISYLFIQTNVKKITSSQLKTEMSQVADYIAYSIKTVNANMVLFTQNELFKKYIASPNMVQHQTIKPLLISKFQKFQKVYPDYYDIRIYSKEGNETARVISDLKPVQDRSKIISTLIRSRLDRLSGFVQSKSGRSLDFFEIQEVRPRLFSQKSIVKPLSFYSYFFIAVDFSSIKSILKKSNIENDAYFYIVNGKGKILFKTGKKNTGHSPFAGEARANQSNMEKSLIKTIISSRVSHLEKYRFYDDKHSVYAGYQRLPDGFFLIGLIPVKSLDFPGLELSHYFLWILLWVALIASLLIFFHVNRVLINPIQLLRKQIKQIKEGDFRFENRLYGNDEIAELSDDFKSMSDALAKSAERVNSLAYYDPLTGLANRTTFQIQISKAINHCQRMDTSLALLYIDIDDFKYVNDVYGHHIGDNLLKEAAIRLEDCLRSVDYISRQEKDYEDWTNDMVVRLGGDEFTVILNDVLQAHQVSIIAQRIVKSLSTPFIMGDSELTLSASIGIAMFPMDGQTSDQLIKSADLAMYEAKQKGKNNFHFFTSALDAAVTKRLELENDLQIALEHGQFFVVYQPKVDANNGLVKSIEALVRWQHPEKGLIFPSQFIPVAEDTRKIIDIGAIVLQKTCKQIKYWRKNNINNLTVSVNLSAVQLVTIDMFMLIKQNLEKYQIPTGALGIEISENLLAKDVNKSIDVLNKIKQLGVNIALDDFGSGFSSLSYLGKWPIDTLKIDRSFILEIENNFESQMVMKAIVALAKALSLKIVAEGVETISQLQLVRHYKCDLIQGYLFSKPVLPEKLCLNYSAQLDKYKQGKLS